MTQPTGCVAALSSSVCFLGLDSYTLAGRGRGRVGTSSLGGNQNHIYALVGRQDLKSSPYIDTSILFVSSHDVYELIDLDSTLSFVTPFISGRFGIEPELLIKLFAVSMLIGESIIARRVYQGCTLIICSRNTFTDLVELELVYFDVIIGMDWLASCYAIVECWTKIVSF